MTQCHVSGEHTCSSSKVTHTHTHTNEGYILKECVQVTITQINLLNFLAVKKLINMIMYLYELTYNGVFFCNSNRVSIT